VNNPSSARSLAVARLLRICRDCENALRTAAEVTESMPAIKDYCERAEAWDQFCRAVERIVRARGGAPSPSPSVRSILRRAWITIQSVGGGTDAIAAECAKQEAAARQSCTELIGGDCDAELCEVVQKFLIPLVPSG
jgi:uncharacterized protein (TIGR02284 family)